MDNGVADGPYLYVANASNNRVYCRYGNERFTVGIGDYKRVKCNNGMIEICRKFDIFPTKMTTEDLARHALIVTVEGTVFRSVLVNPETMDKDIWTSEDNNRKCYYPMHVYVANATNSTIKVNSYSSEIRNEPRFDDNTFENVEPLELKKLTGNYVEIYTKDGEYIYCEQIKTVRSCVIVLRPERGAVSITKQLEGEDISISAWIADGKYLKPNGTSKVMRTADYCFGKVGSFLWCLWNATGSGQAIARFIDRMFQ